MQNDLKHAEKLQIFSFATDYNNIRTQCSKALIYNIIIPNFLINSADLIARGTMVVKNLLLAGFHIHEKNAPIQSFYWLGVQTENVQSIRFENKFIFYPHCHFWDKT